MEKEEFMMMKEEDYDVNDFLVGIDPVSSDCTSSEEDFMQNEKSFFESVNSSEMGNRYNRSMSQSMATINLN